MSAQGLLAGTPTQAGLYIVHRPGMRQQHTATAVPERHKHDHGQCAGSALADPDELASERDARASLTMCCCKAAAACRHITGLTPSLMPPGLQLTAAGEITGTPTQAGSYLLNITLSDSQGTPPASGEPVADGCAAAASGGDDDELAGWRGGQSVSGDAAAGIRRTASLSLDAGFRLAAPGTAAERNRHDLGNAEGWRNAAQQDLRIHRDGHGCEQSNRHGESVDHRASRLRSRTRGSGVESAVVRRHPERMPLHAGVEEPAPSAAEGTAIAGKISRR